MNLKRLKDSILRIEDADFKIVPKDGSYAVVYPDEGVRYWINQRGGKWVCSCPGCKHRGTCKHLAELQNVDPESQQKHGTEARIAQIEKSLKVWQERFEQNPSKQNEKMLKVRQQALAEAQEKLEQEKAAPKPKRHPREQFEKFLPEVEEIFKGHDKWKIVGSWARGKSTYKDIDVIVATDKSGFEKIYERLSADENYEEIMHGPDLIRGYYHGEMFDVTRVPNQDEWGAFEMYRIGSKDFNVAVRGKLKSFGWGLSERGLISPEGDVVASKSEEDIFEHMGIPFIPPEKREKGSYEKIIKDINPHY